MQEFLAVTDIIDWDHPAVSEQARTLAIPDNPIDTARACFEFVRDHIQHSGDYRRNPATCRASDVLQHRTGYCYSKSHLLAALLRANGIPTGFCYQRLSVHDTGAPYSLHGYNAVHLTNVGWYRIDARGNKPGVHANFDPPIESLAFPPQCAAEFDFENIFAEPLACVVEVLRKCTGWEDVTASLPDIEPDQFEAMGMRIRSCGPS